MTGQLVLWISRRLLHAESVALIMAPAVADLQHEASTATLVTRARGQVAIWVAFVGALWHELVWDPQGADRFDVPGITTILFVVTSYHLGLVTLLLDFGNWKRVSIPTVLRGIDGQWVFLVAIVVVLVATVTRHAQWRARADRSLASNPDV